MPAKRYRARRRWLVEELRNCRLGRRPPFRWEVQNMFEMCRRELVSIRVEFYAAEGRR